MAEDREKVIKALIKSNNIRRMYNDFIIKEVPFETWVRGMVDRLLSFPREVDPDIRIESRTKNYNSPL